MKMNRTLAHVGAALALATSWTTAVRAADHSSAPTKVVQIADLNLSSPKDVAELLRRIDAAAQEVCPNPDSESGIRANQARYCVQQAIKNAVKHVDSPALTALSMHERAHVGSRLLARNTP